MINIDDRIEEFTNIMCGIITVKFMEWLINEGFFTAPASTKYHGSCEGGLFDHSFVVTEALIQLTKDNNLKWEKERSPFIVGMFHDLCKIDQYNKITDEDGSSHYEYSNTEIKGHGEKSVIYLQKFMDLTEEEILCIRWHMGAFDEKENWNGFTKSVHQYPNVLWTHQADMIAAHVNLIDAEVTRVIEKKKFTAPEDWEELAGKEYDIFVVEYWDDGGKGKKELWFKIEDHMDLQAGYKFTH